MRFLFPPSVHAVARQNTMRESNTLDFYDMVRLATLLLKGGGGGESRAKSAGAPSAGAPSAVADAAAAVAAAVRRKHKFVLVDEFQDVSGPQFAFLKALVGPESGRVTVVGDDDQSIYGFQVPRELSQCSYCFFFSSKERA